MGEGWRPFGASISCVIVASVATSSALRCPFDLAGSDVTPFPSFPF